MVSPVLPNTAVQKFFDNSGSPLSGGKLFTYAAGTLTKQASYTDSTGNTANTNPIILNSRGEANVWLDPSLTYKQILAPSTDTDPPTNAIWTVDNITGNPSPNPVFVSVKSYGAAGNGIADDTVAIQAAINFVQTAGGSVYFPSGTYKITSSLVIGNGSANAFSTYAGVQLVGAGGGVLPGPGNLSAVTLNSNIAGPAIKIQGPIGSWGVENIAINITTTSTAAIGLQVISGQNGRTRNLMVTGCYGSSIVVTTVGTAYLSYHNKYDSTSIYLPAGAAAALGIVVTGAGATGGSTGAAFEEWHNTYIVIANAGQTGRVLQYCDNINFFNTEIVNAANGTGVQYNYSSTGLNGTSFPADCRDFGLEVYGNTILNYAPSGIGSLATPNRIFGFSLTNGAAVPNLSNLSVLNEAGTSKCVIFLTGAQSIGNANTKVLLDTKLYDNDTIADVATNHRITPKRKGYYQLDGQVTAASFAGASSLLGWISVNGATQVALSQISNNGVVATAKTAVVALFNGTTDYVELFANITGGSTALTTGQQNTFLSLLGPFP